MTKQLSVVAYYTDGGDGSGTFWLFNSIEDLQKAKAWDDEKLKVVLDEDDTYTNGEITYSTIPIEEVDGKLQLITPDKFWQAPTLHWGQ